MHKSLFDRFGYFDENLEVCEDYDLWLRIASEEEIALVDKKLIKKYAGHEDQLSFKYWGMDRFRVRSLEKLLTTTQESQYFQIVLDELKKKYEVLLKGAIKYDKTEDIKNYRMEIEKFSLL